ncbi:hypothetical protein K438DRAFT_2031520 [Mycena galopus ATCC 62051]|nr:hypothetical protein K438DRAFT_2031520 [Mycena galopus ATCC 62051]
MLWAVLTVGDYPIDSASDAAYTKHQKRGAGYVSLLCAPIPNLFRTVVCRSDQALSARSRIIVGLEMRTTRTAVMVGNINKEDSTFEIAVMQYISATKKHEVFPVRCLIPDSPRWQKCKPVPAHNELVSITRFLTGVERDDDHTVKHFIIDVDLPSADLDLSP